MDNRREHTRFRTAVAAELEVDGEVFSATTRDVSEGGASIVTDARLSDGGTISLTLILTEDGIESANAEALTTQATVMWSAPTDSGETMAGLRFEKLSAAAARNLAQLLAASNADR
jgi:c-di-GMP-binding flagellar brake protein YcgR